jgi:hypothetical protein
VIAGSHLDGLGARRGRGLAHAHSPGRRAWAMLCLALDSALAVCRLNGNLARLRLLSDRNL